MGVKIPNTVVIAPPGPQGPPGEDAPPLDEDLVLIAEADNGEILRQIDSPFTLDKEQQFNLGGLDEDTRDELLDAAARNRRERSQIISVAATGDVPIDLSEGRFVHIPETAGAWSPLFLEIPSGGVEVILSVNVTSDDHEMTVPNSVWKKGTTAPVTADYDAADQMVFRMTKSPFAERWILEWLDEGTAPDLEPDPLTPPSVTAVWSTSPTGSSPTDLTGATLPAGEVAIFVGPDSDEVESYRLFVNLVGSVPAIGEEGDAYVGKRTTSPFSLLGTVDSTPVLWDTNEDPTGNNRNDYDSNGETTLTVAPRLIDGTEPTATTFTFDTSNAPPGTTPVIDPQPQAYPNANTDGAVTVPDGVDRVVVVQAHYKVTGSAQSISGMTLSGNALTNIAAATNKDGQLLGVWTGYITEADLSTGTDQPLVVSWAVTPGAASAIVYNVWVVSNVDTPAFGGDYDYDNVSPGSPTSPSPSIAAVPANSILLSAGTQADTDTSAMTVDVGTATTTTTITGFLEGRSSSLADSGASATETVNWVGSGKGYGTLVYLDYTASGGGSGTTPITPGTPSVALTTPADNQIVATWSATTDAVSYELRHGTSNPPAQTPFTVTSPRTISGLAASVVRYVQVRAVSSDGTRSAWSTVQSATPTGEVAPPPEFSGKMLTAATPYDVSYVEGRASYDYTAVSGLSPGFRVASAMRRRNPSSTEFAMRNLAQDSWLDDAIARWNSRRGSSAFVEQMGPRLPVSAKLGPLNIGNNNATSSPAESAGMIADMGRTGSKGTINRDDTLIALGNQLNRQYRGFNVWEIVMLSAAHETNGPWSKSGYMGKNPNVIGQPVLTSATNSQYGSEMGAALRKAGATGECADVHRLAVQRFMEVLWDIQPNIVIGMTPSDGSDSIPPDQPQSSNTNDWVYDAFPRPSEGFQLDFLCPTIYSRMPGDMIHTGGSRDVYSNWKRGNSDNWLEYADEYVAEHSCAFGFLEIGVSYAVPGEGLTADDVSAPSDEANAAFYERLFNHELTTTRFPQGFVFVNHWTIARWQGKPPGVKVGGVGGGSYVLNEGMWGEYPGGTNITSLAKPSWSSVGTPGYSKTLDWFEENYPR